MQLYVIDTRQVRAGTSIPTIRPDLNQRQSNIQRTDKSALRYCLHLGTTSIYGKLDFLYRRHTGPFQIKNITPPRASCLLCCGRAFFRIKIDDLDIRCLYLLSLCIFVISCSVDFLPSYNSYFIQLHVVSMSTISSDDK